MTWEEYKEEFKKSDPELYKEIMEPSIMTAKIVARRHALGITQKELAKACGISRFSIKRIENLKSSPDMDTLTHIIDCLDNMEALSAA